MRGMEVGGQRSKVSSGKFQLPSFDPRDLEDPATFWGSLVPKPTGRASESRADSVQSVHSVVKVRG